MNIKDPKIKGQDLLTQTRKRDLLEDEPDNRGRVMKLKGLKILQTLGPFLGWTAALSMAQELSRRQCLVYFEGTEEDTK